MGPLLSIIAIVLAIAGIVQLVQGDFLWAIGLFVAAAAIGPGGWTILRREGE